MIKDLIPGADVWVVGRDECGEAFDVTGFMFIAKVSDFVICSPFICGVSKGDVDTTLAYFVDETAEGCPTSLHTFPLEDCFATLNEAKEAYAGENGR